MAAFGWEVDGGAPDVPKAVVVAAPHTSNWDMPFTMATAYVLGIDFAWVGKNALFKPPFGSFFRWLGGVPVDRSQRTNFVAAVADAIRAQERVLLVIAPEGTRSISPRWKTGFYRIAEAAEVPIVLGYLDYSRKRAGLGTVFWPTGDMAKDLEQIRDFYAEKRGKHPERESPIVLGGDRDPKSEIKNPIVEE